MEHVSLKAQKRSLASKGYLNQLRRDGKIPAVLHNRGDESMHLAVHALDLKKAMHTPAGINVVLNLEVDGEEQYLSRIEEIQYDVLRDGVYLHAEFGRISLDQDIEVNVPVVIAGQDQRASDDGVISQTLHEITIRSKPDSIPANLQADISKLTIGDVLVIRDIELPAGCTAVAEPDEAVVSIIAPRVAEKEETVESEASPLDDLDAGQKPELVE